jgi:hypothetical protein
MRSSPRASTFRAECRPPAAPGAHELLAEIQLRLGLIVGAATQLDVRRFVSAALAERVPVMKLDEASRTAALAETIDIDATAIVPQPDLTSYRRGNRA